jgi:hypothetical protein
MFQCTLTFILLRRLARDVYLGFEGAGEELDVSADGVLGGATKWSQVQKFCRWVKNIKQNMMLLKSISHPHIAALRRHWCNKEIQGAGNCESVMWQMQLIMLLRGRRDVDAIASDGEWQIWLLISQLIVTHLVASAHCSRGYCRDVCATRFMCWSLQREEVGRFTWQNSASK